MGAALDQKRMQEFVQGCLTYERPPVFIRGLSPIQNLILSMLTRDGPDPMIVPMDALLKLTGNDNNLKVHIHGLRKKLPTGVTVYNAPALGYYMTQKDRDKLRKMFGQ